MFYGNNHDFLQICTGKSDETENGKKRLFGRWRREMFREIRKKKNAITADAAESLLEKSRRGVLAVNGDDGYPYAVPVNYVYDNGKIYIHSAKYGYKIEALKNSDRVCFSAILNSRVQQDMFTAAYQSVVAFGRASFVEDDAERRRILEQFIYKLSPDFVEGGMKFVDAAIGKTALICIDVEEIKGKENMAKTFDVK